MNNEGYRETARKLGFRTYQKEVTEFWPACVDCGEVIRTEVKGIRGVGIFRKCQCPNRVWQCHMRGWEIYRD